MIRKLELINFTVFEELSIDFSAGINVIIGENGTGKTQLLKAAYALASTSSKNQGIDPKDIEKVFTEKFNRIFMPEEMRIGKLSRCAESKCASIKASFIEDYKYDRNIKFDFSSRVESLKLDTTSSDISLYKMEPIFIPTKEVLSLYRGLSNYPENADVFKTIFDDSYFDICSQLANDKNEGHEARIQSFLEEIVNKIQGKFEFDDSSIVFDAGLYEAYADKQRKDSKFVRTEEDKLSTHMVAEGFRKLGVLHRLLDNSTLVPKVSGPLFWDEPESNMNPKLMKLIVEVFIELAKKEQQIILTTHDYVLLKWFDLLSDETVHIKYHVLSRDEDTKKVILTSTDNYLDIKPNSIDDVFADLIDSDIQKSMGNLGK